jgi:DNA repair ATPase RecN
MKIDLRYILLLATCAIFAWMISSCNTQKPIAETISNTEVNRDSTTNTTTEITTSETIKESEYSHTIDADSAYTALLLQCDSAGNVLVASIEQLQGERTDLALQLQKVKEGILLEIKAIQAKYDVLVKGLRKEVERLEKENTELRATTTTDASVEKQEPVIIKEVPGWVDWVKWFAWIGGAAILYVLLRIAFWIYKKFLKVV